MPVSHSTTSDAYANGHSNGHSEGQRNGQSSGAAKPSDRTHGRPRRDDTLPETMKGVFWEGKPFEMAVKTVPRARIINDDDAIVRVTTAAICGTDLHTFHGIFGSAQIPFGMGHEAIGIVVEVGDSVDTIKVGDRVIIPDFPDTGSLQEEEPLIPNFATFGLGADFGNLGGCQAEFVRVPFADKSLFVINNEIGDNEFIFLTDIFSTAWTALDFAGFQPGDDVTVFGAGPVGLLCAYSAFIRGASRVFSVDHVPARLEKAKSIGAIPINLAHGKPADQILKLAPNGTARVCDCIGYECVNEKLKPEQGFVINQAVEIVSTGGGIGVIGVYFAEPSSKGAPRGSIMSPNITFPITKWWFKNITMKGGAVDTKTVVPILLELIAAGRAKPSFIISAELQGLDKAEDAYRRFSDHLETKIVFKFPWRREDLSVASSRQAIGLEKGDHGEDRIVDAHDRELERELRSRKHGHEDEHHEHENKSFEEFAREIRTKRRRRI